MDGGNGSNRSRWLFAVGGPVVIGAIVGLPGAAEGILHGMTVIPLVLFGVALSTLPALYIGCSMAGVAPPARDVAGAALRGGRNAGVAFLGLALPLAFLIGSSHSGFVAPVLGMVVLGAGGFAALRAIWADLFAGNPSRRARWDAAVVFCAWAAIATAIGARLFYENLRGS